MQPGTALPCRNLPPILREDPGATPGRSSKDHALPICFAWISSLNYLWIMDPTCGIRGVHERFVYSAIPFSCFWIPSNNPSIHPIIRSIHRAFNHKIKGFQTYSDLFSFVCNITWYTQKKNTCIQNLKTSRNNPKNIDLQTPALFQGFQGRSGQCSACLVATS